MLIFQESHLKSYLQHDCILNQLNQSEFTIDKSFTSCKWLEDSAPKRLIYYYMYQDLLEKSNISLKVLDVGGGYSPLTRIIINNHNYKLLEIFAHDNNEKLENLKSTYNNKSFWYITDWYNYTPESSYDLIIANDLFRNVDQRLQLFLDKYLPISKKIRLSLTYYNEPRFYRVKRTEADEILWLLAWSGEYLALTLEKYKERIENPSFDLLLKVHESLFPNKRQVVMVNIKGDL